MKQPDATTTEEPVRLEYYHCARCNAILLQVPQKYRNNTFPHDFYCGHCAPNYIESLAKKLKKENPKRCTKCGNRRRELRNLNRMIKALRGIYQEAARSSLEATCVELGKERDAARKECERLRAILAGPEGRIRGPYDFTLTSVTGSSTLGPYSPGYGGDGGAGDKGGGHGRP